MSNFDNFSQKLLFVFIQNVLHVLKTIENLLMFRKNLNFFLIISNIYLNFIKLSTFA